MYTFVYVCMYVHMYVCIKYNTIKYIMVDKNICYSIICSILLSPFHLIYCAKLLKKNYKK